ncbi:Gustatory receptor 147, partial [Hyalella azteca]
MQCSVATCLITLLWLCGCYVPGFTNAAAPAQTSEHLESEAASFNPGKKRASWNSTHCLLTLWVWIVYAVHIGLLIFFLSILRKEFDDEQFSFIRLIWLTSPMLFFLIVASYFHYRRVYFTELVERLNHLSKDFKPINDIKYFYVKFLPVIAIYGILISSTATSISVGGYKSSLMVEISVLGIYYTLFVSSYCIFLDILKRSYGKITENLAHHVESLNPNRIIGILSEESTDGVFQHGFTTDDSLARQTKRYNLLIEFERDAIFLQECLDLVQKSYSMALFFCNIISMANVVLGLFLLLDALVQNSASQRSWASFGISVWSLTLLLWMHSSADDVNQARQESAWGLRRFLHANQNDFGLSLSGVRALTTISEPFPFSMLGFSGIGRSALTNVDGGLHCVVRDRGAAVPGAHLRQLFLCL